MPALPPIRPIRITSGGQVPLRDIVGRDETIASWWKDLDGTSLRLNEPRRIGKTTALRKMASEPPPGWLCTLTTLEGRTTTLDLVNHALADLSTHANQSKVFDVVRKSLRHVKEIDLEFPGVKVQVGPGSNPLSAFDALVRVLHETDAVLEKQNRRLLIIWDEFPDTIRAISEKEGVDVAADIMGVFRALRESYETRHIRWILCGSVGFHHALRQLRSGLGPIDDLAVAPLGPLSPEWAQWLAACYLRSLDLTDLGEAAPWLAKESDGIPFVMELMVKAISMGAPQPTNLAEARQLLVSAATGTLTEGLPLLERVSRLYGDNVGLANWILDRIGEAPRTSAELVRGIHGQAGLTTIPDDETVSEVLDLLIYDHYITCDPSTGLLTWTYPCLETIWSTRRRRFS